MALHVALQDNSFDGGKTLRLRVVNRRTVEFPERLRFMAMDTAHSETDMQAMMDRLEAALVFFTANGMRVRTPLGSFAVHVKGAPRVGRREPEISADHAQLKYLPSRRVRSSIRERLEIVAEPAVSRGAPTVCGVDDLEQEQALHVVAVGHLVSVAGLKLTFDRNGPDEGVWFAPPESAKTPFEIANGSVRADLYTLTGSNHVHCRVPESLPPGRNRVLVSSRRYVRRSDKSPKVGAFPFVVEVVGGEGCRVMP